MSSGSRLSSFGFSGTIAHGAFEAGLRGPTVNLKLPSRTKRNESRTRRSGVIEHVRAKIGVVEFLLLLRLESVRLHSE